MLFGTATFIFLFSTVLFGTATFNFLLYSEKDQRMASL